MTVTVLGIIIIPIVLALIGAILASIKGIIAFTRYMVRAESAQISIEKSYELVNHKLDQIAKMAERIDQHLDNHEVRLSMVEAELHGHGNANNGLRPQ